MTVIWVVLSFVGMLVLAALGDLVSEEIRGWLDLVPRGILRLAAAQLDPAQRESIYENEWLPELCYALRGAESRPITRLILGSRYALGLLIAARRVSRRLGSYRAVRPAPAMAPFIFELAEFNIQNSSGAEIVLHGFDGSEIHVSNGNSFIGPVPSADLRELENRGIPFRLA